MSAKIRKPRGWTPGRCRFIAETHLDWFVDFVAKQTRKGDEPITVDSLRELTLRYRETETALPPLFKDSFFTCNQARLNLAWRSDEHDHLVRLLFHQILPLFEEDGGPSAKNGGLSRRMLPGIFYAITQQIGVSAVVNGERQCAAIMRRLRENTGSDFAWDDFFAAPKAQRILIRILADVSLGFDNFETGRDWFIEAINANQTVDHLKNIASAPPQPFNETNFTTFARHFFVPLIRVMGIEAEKTKERRDLDERFDANEMVRIATFLSHIN